MNSEGELELKRTHTYSYQVQGFLAITCNMLFCYIDNQQTQHPDHPSRSWVLGTCSFADYSVLQACYTSWTCFATIQCRTADLWTFSITIHIMQPRITQRLVTNMCTWHFPHFCMTFDFWHMLQPVLNHWTQTFACTLVTHRRIILHMIFHFAFSKMVVHRREVAEVPSLGLFCVHSWLFSKLVTKAYLEWCRVR